MERIRYDYDLQFYMKGPKSRKEVLGNVYELTDEEVYQLKAVKNAQDGDYLELKDSELYITSSGEIIADEIKNIRPGMIIHIPEPEIDKGIIGILKENIKHLQKVRKDISGLADKTGEETAISREINNTVENLITAYKQAGITQDENHD